MKKQGLILVTLLTITMLHLSGQVILSDWEMAKESVDNKIYYRNIYVGDSLETRQMRINFKIKSTKRHILELFRRTENLSEWTKGSKVCKILENNESNWLTYTLYNIPWPFNNKDLVSRYQLVENDSHDFSILINAEPSVYPVKEKIERVKNYKGEWCFTLLDDGTYDVEFLSVIFTEPVVPRFLQDPVVQSVLIDSIDKFKKMALVEKEVVADNINY
jgi:hypothetical protein